MSDFKNGGVPSPDYDKDDVTIFNDTTEFTNDVFVYGNTYSQSFWILLPLFRDENRNL